MESSYLLKLSPVHQEILAQDDALTAELLDTAINAHAEQIGYMLQAYFPREKISRVVIIPGSILIHDPVSATLQLEFVKEEFNTCSAIDSELKDKMTITVMSDSVSGVLRLEGERWPEL